MLLDERAFLGTFQRRAAAEAIHHIVEQLARASCPKAFARICSAVPGNHLPLPAGAAGDSFASSVRIARTERALPSRLRERAQAAVGLLNRRGFTDQVCVQNKTVVTDPRAGCRNNRWEPVLQRHGLTFTALPDGTLLASIRREL